jgi:hypothetical protein
MQVLLLSEGFGAAKPLAKKMVALFMLSRELLSQQQHYDWGLRALKTSLGIAGRELRQVREIVISTAVLLARAHTLAPIGLNHRKQSGDQILSHKQWLLWWWSMIVELFVSSHENVRPLVCQADSIGAPMVF